MAKLIETFIQEIIRRDLPKKNTYVRFNQTVRPYTNLKENSFLVAYGKRELKKLSKTYPLANGIIKLYDQTYQRDLIKEQYSEHLGKSYPINKAIKVFTELQSLRANTKAIFISEVPIDLFGTKTTDFFKKEKLYTETLNIDSSEVSVIKNSSKLVSHRKPLRITKNKETESSMSPLGNAMEEFKETLNLYVNEKSEAIKENTKETRLISNNIYELTVEDFVIESIKGAIFEDTFGNELYYDKKEINPFIYNNTPIMYWGIFDGKTPYKFIKYKSEKEKCLVKKYKIYKGSANFSIETDNITKTLKELGGTRYEEINNNLYSKRDYGAYVK